MKLVLPHPISPITMTLKRYSWGSLQEVSDFTGSATMMEAGAALLQGRGLGAGGVVATLLRGDLVMVVGEVFKKEYFNLKLK